MKEKPVEVEEFFWGHLQKDVACLAEALSRNTEDAVLTVHLFLQHLSNHTPAGRGTLGSSGRSPVGSRRCHWFLLPGTTWETGGKEDHEGRELI